MQPTDRSITNFEHYYLQDKIDKKYDKLLEARKLDSQDFINSCENNEKSYSLDVLPNSDRSNMPLLSQEENK